MQWQNQLNRGDSFSYIRDATQIRTAGFQPPSQIHLPADDAASGHRL
jgi:hypothetical protein